MKKTLLFGRGTEVGRELDAWTHRLTSSKATTAQTNEKSPYERARYIFPEPRDPDATAVAKRAFLGALISSFGGIERGL